MGRVRTSLLVGCVAAALLLAGAGSALAAPVWRLTSEANTTVAPGGELTYYLAVQNVGNEPASGPIEVTAKLPEDMTSAGATDFNTRNGEMFTCTGEGTREVRCTTQAGIFFGNYVTTAEQDGLGLRVDVAPGASGTLTPAFQLSGNGAAPVSTVDPTDVTSVLPGFGVSAFDMRADADLSGSLFTQAGGHPYDLVTHIDFNTAHNDDIFKYDLWPVAPVKDTVVDLPPGIVGDPTVVTRCSARQLASTSPAAFVPLPACPSSSQVGVVQLTRSAGNISPQIANNKIAGPYALYNMVPPPGIPARFGFAVNGTSVVLDAKVRSNGDYGISVVSRGISEAVPVAGVTVTFWGVPADPSHDAERACPGQREIIEEGPSCPAGVSPQAFLRYPTSCSAPGVGLPVTLHVDSWADPGSFDGDGLPDTSDPAWLSQSAQSHLDPSYPYPQSMWGAPQGTTNCQAVPFMPALQVAPTAHSPETPSGLQVTLSMPQEGLTDPAQIAQADLKRVVVRLPEGMQINPSAAGGLAGCSSAQIALSSIDAPTCPPESDIGSVKIETPLLQHPLEGSVYLASQDDNPFESLLAIYVVAEGEGVIVKLPGHIEADPATGQLTTTFDNQPQLPFSNLVLGLKQGPRAPLLTPATCGSKTISSTLEGWNGKTVTLANSYDVQCAPGGGGFAPSFTAGAVDNRAGAFTPLGISFARNDAEQRIAALTVTLPPGASAKLAGIPLCSDGDANAGACPEASRIGTVTVGSGGGPNPFFLTGKIYLTGPYNGGPFGEVVVVPAVAGPFHLGDVVVRGSIRIDPATAQATVVSDPFPQMVNQTGIPTDVRRVDVDLDRASFTLNPTNCAPASVNGTFVSTQGVVANVSSGFQAANCANLPFHPQFSASTRGNGTLRGHGASLRVKLSFPHSGPQAASQGGEANIRSVKVSLPKALPSRLATLQKACSAAQFQANPAGCPQAAYVGTATAHTPILANPLTGPAILVSHGGAAFPDLDIVLQGEGITIVLTGNTAIKNGVTTSTFAAIPDTPVTDFELRLPEGEHSALAAIGDPCRENLLMPIAFVAQNGATLDQDIRIGAEGCTKQLLLASHHLQGRSLSLTVAVPGAGRLLASGRGLSKAAKSAPGRGTITVKLRVRRRGRFSTTIRLVFSSRSGKRLVKSVSVSA